MNKTQHELIIDRVGLNKIEETAKQLISLSADCKIWLLIGDMGAGKTTLVKAVCSQLGVDDNVTSPTFSIVNEYKSPIEPVYHFDFYRVNTLEEALEVGVEDYFFSGNYCFIEWPELIVPILPSQYVTINIVAGLGTDRKYKITHYGID